MNDGAVALTRPDWTSSSLGERVEHVCALRGWSLNHLGEEAGLASGVVSRLARRSATVAGAPDTLARVADAAGVNIVWLMLGRGPIERDERGRPIKMRPELQTALEEAQKRQRGLPDEFWSMATEAVRDAPWVDWQLLVGVAREMYWAYQRLAEQGGTAASEEAPSTPVPSTERDRGSSRKVPKKRE